MDGQAAADGMDPVRGRAENRVVAGLPVGDDLRPAGPGGLGGGEFGQLIRLPRRPQPSKN
jgi:hypothetical protein